VTEAQFTPASGWCPHPEHWHASDAQATEHEVTALVGALTVALQPELVIETGTHTAQTAAAIGGALASNGHGRLITCETDRALADRAAYMLGQLPVQVLCGHSLDVLPPVLAGAGDVGLCWLDSSAQARRSELVLLRRYLAPGAVIGVHDTRPGRPPARALAQPWLTVLTLRTPRGVSFAQITEGK